MENSCSDEHVGLWDVVSQRIASFVAAPRNVVFLGQTWIEQGWEGVREGEEEGEMFGLAIMQLESFLY